MSLTVPTRVILRPVSHKWPHPSRGRFVPKLVESKPEFESMSSWRGGACARDCGRTPLPSYIARIRVRTIRLR